MRPWRDIISTKAWKWVVENADSTARMSKMTALKSKFDSEIDTPKRSLQRLTNAIEFYHNLQKDDFNQLELRIQYLGHISSMAKDHMQRWNVNMEKAKERVVLQKNYANNTEKLVPLERHPDTGHYASGNAYDQTLDRNLLSLRNRALRKAKYLQGLKDYYSNSRDPAKLLTGLLAPQQSDHDSIGLVQGVRMEAIDPWHRPVEVKFTNGKLVENKDLNDSFSSSSAFTAWYKELQANSTIPPYFLWLEKHPICTNDDKADIAGTASVAYLDQSVYKNIGGAPQYKLAMVYRYGNQLVMWDMVDKAQTRWATTQGYACNSEKGVNTQNLGGNFTGVKTNEAAAYIWDKKGHMIAIAQHQENSFHHSSFAAGGSVNCAGMIQFKLGKVVYVSNNSGHYKPTKQLLAAFVKYLGQNNLFDANAVVHCFGLKNKFMGSPQHFIQTLNSLA